MDLNLIMAAQRTPSNQFTFDQDACDQAVLRAEKRREFVQKILATLHAQLRAVGEYQIFNANMATPKRFG